MAKVVQLEATADTVYRLDAPADLSQNGVCLVLPAGTILIVPDGMRIVSKDPSTIWHQ